MPPFQPFCVRVTENPIPKKVTKVWPSLGAHMFRLFRFGARSYWVVFFLFFFNFFLTNLLGFSRWWLHRFLGFLFTSIFSFRIHWLNQHLFFCCQQCCFLFPVYTHTIHVWYISLNVGKYTIHGSYGIYQAFLNLWIVVLRHVHQVPGFSNYVWKTTWEKRDLVVCLGKNIQKSWKP